MRRTPRCADRDTDPIFEALIQQIVEGADVIRFHHLGIDPEIFRLIRQSRIDKLSWRYRPKHDRPTTVSDL